MSTAWLPDRSVILVTGTDRVSFLQGLVSNDVATATPEHVVWTGFLTPQGRYLSDFFIVAMPDHLLLDVPNAHADILVTRLSRFRLRADVKLERTEFAVQAGWGDAQRPADAWQDPRLPEAGWRRLALSAASFDADEAKAYDRHRISLGLPSPEDCVAEKTLLLEANFDRLHGISWKKGCYMGQELTARTHYRGLVKKRLVRVTGRAPLPEIGETLFADGKEAGDMRTSEGTTGLAMVRREFWKTDLTHGEQSLRVTPPDWFERDGS